MLINTIFFLKLKTELSIMTLLCINLHLKFIIEG